MHETAALRGALYIINRLRDNGFRALLAGGCVRDTVMVSSSLDSADAPEFVVDFILYHELLHKKLGVSWRNGRAMAHTTAFRQAERLFPRHAEANAALNGLAHARGKRS